MSIWFIQIFLILILSGVDKDDGFNLHQLGVNVHDNCVDLWLVWNILLPSCVSVRDDIRIENIYFSLFSPNSTIDAEKSKSKTGKIKLWRPFDLFYDKSLFLMSPFSHDGSYKLWLELRVCLKPFFSILAKYYYVYLTNCVWKLQSIQQ